MAGNSQIIYGNVTDPEGRPIRGAWVDLNWVLQAANSPSRVRGGAWVFIVVDQENPVEKYRAESCGETQGQTERS